MPFHQAPIPAAYGLTVHFPNKHASQLVPNALQDTRLTVARFLFASVLVAVPFNQCRHSEVHLALHIQVAVFIACRHLLALYLFRKFESTVHLKTAVMTSFPPTDLPHLIAYSVN